MKYTIEEYKIWDVLMQEIRNPYGVAGVMGNLYAESRMNPKNLQGSFEKMLGMTDEEYTDAVDSGTYTNFVYDGAGYGLAQWTFSSRKKSLLELAKSMGASVGDLDIQLAFLIAELRKFTSVMNVLKTCDNVAIASEFVMLKYEMPADISEQARLKRQTYSEGYLLGFQKDMVRVTGEHVNIRDGDGIGYGIWSVAKLGDIFEYVAESIDGGWYAIRVEDAMNGKMVKWISAKYAEKYRG